MWSYNHGAGREEKACTRGKIEVQKEKSELEVRKQMASGAQAHCILLAYLMVQDSLNG